MAGHRFAPCFDLMAKLFDLPVSFASSTMLLQGILLGFSLSFLVGPLLFAVVEAGISQGFRAGLSVASGIWFSDILFVSTILWSVETLAAVTAIQGFRTWVGILGGLLLIAFGLGSLFLKSKVKDGAEHKVEKRSYLSWWLRGFLLNLINPGTIFFWLGIVSAVVVPNNWTREQSMVFFAGMLGMLILTDTLKAWAAKRVRKFLTPHHARQIQKVIGMVLLVFGSVLIFRAIFILI